MGERILRWRNNNLLLPHQLSDRRWGFISVMTTFGHDDEEHAIGSFACCIVESFSNVGCCGVANDEEVLPSTDVHAGFNDHCCAGSHGFFRGQFPWLFVDIVGAVGFNRRRHAFFFVKKRFNVRVYGNRCGVVYAFLSEGRSHV